MSNYRLLLLFDLEMTFFWVGWYESQSGSITWRFTLSWGPFSRCQLRESSIFTITRLLPFLVNHRVGRHPLFINASGGQAGQMRFVVYLSQILIQLGLEECDSASREVSNLRGDRVEEFGALPLEGLVQEGTPSPPSDLCHHSSSQSGLCSMWDADATSRDQQFRHFPDINYFVSF